MIKNGRILAIALVAALVGGSLGAIAMRSSESSSPAAPVVATNTAPNLTNPNLAGEANYSEATYNATTSQPVPNELKTPEQQDAYKIGFADGFQAAGERRNGTLGTARTQTVSRNTSSPAASRTSYSHVQRNGRTFWQKHRDKLTMGMGAGGGALIGALAGGKKGAAIGSLAGLGGSALYTYKIRKRNHR